MPNPPLQCPASTLSSESAFQLGSLTEARMYWQGLLDTIILGLQAGPSRARPVGGNVLPRVSLGDTIVAAIQPRISQMETRLSMTGPRPEAVSRSRKLSRHVTEYRRRASIAATKALLLPAASMLSKLTTLALTGALIMMQLLSTAAVTMCKPRHLNRLAVLPSTRPPCHSDSLLLSSPS